MALSIVGGAVWLRAQKRSRGGGGWSYCGAFTGRLIQRSYRRSLAAGEFSILWFRLQPGVVQVVARRRFCGCHVLWRAAEHFWRKELGRGVASQQGWQDQGDAAGYRVDVSEPMHVIPPRLWTCLTCLLQRTTSGRELTRANVDNCNRFTAR